MDFRFTRSRPRQSVVAAGNDREKVKEAAMAVDQLASIVEKVKEENDAMGPVMVATTTTKTIVEMISVEKLVVETLVAKPRLALVEAVTIAKVAMFAITVAKTLVEVAELAELAITIL